MLRQIHGEIRTLRKDINREQAHAIAKKNLREIDPISRKEKGNT